MINVYFLLKDKGECVGAVSLREFHPDRKIYVWETYKIFPVTENNVVFKNLDSEFCTVKGKYSHEMGEISVKFINDEWINVNVKEK